MRDLNHFPGDTNENTVTIVSAAGVFRVRCRVGRVRIVDACVGTKCRDRSSSDNKFSARKSCSWRRHCLSFWNDARQNAGQSVRNDPHVGTHSGDSRHRLVCFLQLPDECATRPCTAADFANPAVQGRVANFGGRIVGADGVADFAEDRAAGDTTNVFLGMGFGPGLIDPRRAEIHLVVRTHGAASANPATLTEQLTTFNGGCPPNVCANVQAAVHAP